MTIPSSDNAKYSQVMLVDDSSIDNFVNRKIIERYGFAAEVLTFTRVREALRHLLKLSETAQLPDVIFLDLNMPEIDGFEFLTTFNLLGDRVKKHTGIVVLTSSINPTDIVTCNKYKSVVTFLHKPLVKSNLDTLIDLLAKRKDKLAAPDSE